MRKMKKRISVETAKVLEEIPFGEENAISVHTIMEKTDIGRSMVYYAVAKLEKQNLIAKKIKKGIGKSNWQARAYWRLPVIIVVKDEWQELKEAPSEPETPEKTVHKPLLNMDLDELRAYQEYLEGKMQHLENRIERIERIRQIEEGERKLIELEKTLDRIMKEERVVTKELVARL